MGIYTVRSGGAATHLFEVYCYSIQSWWERIKPKRKKSDEIKLKQLNKKYKKCTGNLSEKITISSGYQESKM